MNREIIRLYPEHRTLSSVRGLYLAKNLHRRGFLIYADFATSMDGRIAVKRDGRDTLPAGLTSREDLRLLLELQAQADCVVTHSGYLRARAEGRLGDILRVGALDEHRDLLDWRRAQGLAPQPLVVVCSTTLDFPPPEDLERERVWLVTGGAAEQRRVDELRAQGYRVLTAGRERLVDGRLLAERLRAEGVGAVFLLAGPTLFESLVARRCLDELFLTVSHRFIGGADFHTMMPGLHAHDAHCLLDQRELTLVRTDQQAQWFAHFKCRYETA